MVTLYDRRWSSSEEETEEDSAFDSKPAFSIIPLSSLEDDTSVEASKPLSLSWSPLSSSLRASSTRWTSFFLSDRTSASP